MQLLLGPHANSSKECYMVYSIFFVFVSTHHVPTCTFLHPYFSTHVLPSLSSPIPTHGPTHSPPISHPRLHLVSPPMSPPWLQPILHPCPNTPPISPPISPLNLSPSPQTGSSPTHHTPGLCKAGSHPCSGLCLHVDIQELVRPVIRGYADKDAAV